MPATISQKVIDIIVDAEDVSGLVQLCYLQTVLPSLRQASPQLDAKGRTEKPFAEGSPSETCEFHKILDYHEKRNLTIYYIRIYQ